MARGSPVPLRSMPRKKLSFRTVSTKESSPPLGALAFRSSLMVSKSSRGTYFSSSSMATSSLRRPLTPVPKEDSTSATFSRVLDSA